MLGKGQWGYAILIRGGGLGLEGRGSCESPPQHHLVEVKPTSVRSYMLVNSSQHAAGHRAQFLLQTLSENDTHCVQFSYFLYSRDGHSPGVLRAYVRVNGGPLGNPAWNASGSHGKQWHQVELAVSTFWSHFSLRPVFSDKAPHFSRLGDEEINAGQNASFQCVAAGRAHNGDLLTMAAVKHLSHRRFIVSFQLDGIQRSDQDLYRCVTQSPRGSGVSNFAELVVKVPPSPIAPPQLLRAGSTYLIIQLNTNSILGDGPIIRKEIEYRASQSPWSEVHVVSMATYKMWHLDPDTEYHMSVLLTRPGEGGTGPPGPPLVSRTKCAEPMRPLRGLVASDVQSRQLSLQWENLAFNLTRCHTYSVSLCYRYTMAGGGGGHNTTVRECLAVENNSSRFTLRDLPPYHGIHVRLSLANPEGKKEGREVSFQTEEDIPGGIAPESLTFSPLDDMIFLKWEEPVEPNGLITQYEISYQSIESSDPSINVPGPRRTVSKLRNETYHMFSNLHPGTTYLISVRARTAKGFGQTALTEITTNISAPTFDYGDMPSPLGETESTITVLLRPAQGRGAPVSTYQVVVEEETVKKVKRELGLQECFPLPMSHGEAQARGTPHYYTAELPPSSLPEASPFTVGDNHTYNGYWNSPLDPRKSYLVYFQAMSNFKGVSDQTPSFQWRCTADNTSSSSSSSYPVSHVTVVPPTSPLLIHRKPGNMNKTPITYRQEKSHMGSLERSFTDQSTLQEDERLALSFMDAHTCGTRSKQIAGSPTLDTAGTAMYFNLKSKSPPNQLFFLINYINVCVIALLTRVASSLLGGSPRHQCGRKGSPYHTGQLHPAVRVADLLQHINQMKTAEGYGFKQEYEVKGRRSSLFLHSDIINNTDNFIHYDRHRVKLHPLLGDPNSDYINANYIDVTHLLPFSVILFFFPPGPKQETLYDFWRMVWQENCFSIVMVTKLVEVGRVKCCKYWPDDSEMYGDVKITLLKSETLADYTVRTFALERRGYSAKHEVRQFHFTSWPEHGVPYHSTGLLAFIRRVKASTPPDAGPVVVHCSAGAGRTGCYIVLDVMLDMAECEGVVDIYNCVKTLCSRRINMIQTEEQYIFIHDAILEACLCGETAILVNEFAVTYKEMLRVDSQSNSSQLREEFQTLNSVTPHLDVEECSIALLPRNREKNRSMDVLPPDRALAFLVTTEGESNNYINAALADSFHRQAAFIVTPHPLPGTTADFWRLVFDYGCTAVVMLNQLNQSNSYWPEPGLQQYGPMEVEFLSMSADEEVITRLFRVKNVTRLQEGQLVVCQFQFLRWSAYRDVPDSKKSFLNLLAQVHKWQRECGEGRTVVHCLNGGGRSGTFCACNILLEMIQYQNMADIFYAVKTLRNCKPNMVESLDQYRFCYDLVLEYLDCFEGR
uniref:protein-tyrosine-phosphatase n=1 Tax=Nothobranchius furzeri TaxID=105023 RepID=A0A8C6KN31_NOTFU